MRNIDAALVISLLVMTAAALQGATQPGTGRPLEEYRHFALIHEGDPLHGKSLFEDLEKTACSRCHSIDGTASEAGPDLFAVGDKFGRGEIIESILTPSASIAVGYNTTTVETRSDEEHSGIIKQATDQWIELMGADAKKIR